MWSLILAFRTVCLFLAVQSLLESSCFFHHLIIFFLVWIGCIASLVFLVPGELGQLVFLCEQPTDAAVNHASGLVGWTVAVLHAFNE